LQPMLFPASHVREGSGRIIPIMARQLGQYEGPMVQF
jgi:hypothetical protein